MPSLSAATAVPEAPPPPAIPRRDLRFPIEGVDLRRWHGDGLHVSQFFNALSLFFPEGEAFFIDSVRHFADRIRSPQLAREVRGFLGQEAMHSREHRRYNRALEAAGLPAAELEAGVVAVLDRVRSLASAQQQLAVTIALEHWTAILAHVALSEDEALAGSDPLMTALWRWHAVEETEHKAVAYDVYRDVCGEGVGAYARRAVTMVAATGVFWSLVFLYEARLLRADGEAANVSGWWRLGRFLWISPAVLPKIAIPWLDYFRFGFHPNDQGDPRFVRAWIEAQAGSAGSA